MHQVQQFAHLYQEVINLTGFGFTPKGFAVASLCLMVAFVLSILGIGALMNAIERLQLSLLQKIFGINAALFICNYLTIAGTILHECAHALMGVCTGAKITEISFFDRGGDSLGHVNFIPRGPFFAKAIQYSAVASAPVFAGLVAEYFLIDGIFDRSQPIWLMLLRWYLVVSVIDHTSMSPTDIKLYFKGMWVVAPLIFSALFTFGYFYF
ncbi:MAG: hypothetical protein HUK20_04155 [Fibrobacter sp.]|nr:hypothetical protein [Fibrobacter sp.]